MTRVFRPIFFSIAPPLTTFFSVVSRMFGRSNMMFMAHVAQLLKRGRRQQYILRRILWYYRERQKGYQEVQQHLLKCCICIAGRCILWSVGKCTDFGFVIPPFLPFSKWLKSSVKTVAKLGRKYTLLLFTLIFVVGAVSAHLNIKQSPQLSSF
jgi:hypothetical protein